MLHFCLLSQICDFLVPSWSWSYGS